MPFTCFVYRVYNQRHNSRGRPHLVCLFVHSSHKQVQKILFWFFLVAQTKAEERSAFSLKWRMCVRVSSPQWVYRWGVSSPQWVSRCGVSPQWVSSRIFPHLSVVIQPIHWPAQPGQSIGSIGSTIGLPGRFIGCVVKTSFPHSFCRFTSYSAKHILWAKCLTTASVQQWTLYSCLIWCVFNANL